MESNKQFWQMYIKCANRHIGEGGTYSAWEKEKSDYTLDQGWSYVCFRLIDIF